MPEMNPANLVVTGSAHAAVWRGIRLRAPSIKAAWPETGSVLNTEYSGTVGELMPISESSDVDPPRQPPFVVTSVTD